MRPVAPALFGAMLSATGAAPIDAWAQGALDAPASSAAPEGSVAPAPPLAVDPDVERKQACARAYEAAQHLRGRGKLRAARTELLACAQRECPAVAHDDCTRWLVEVEQSLPTLVFAIRDARGRDTTEVRVLFDGELLLPRLTGLAVPVDPGAHTLRFIVAGAPPRDVPVVLREGEKRRLVSLSFAPPGADAAPPSERPTPAVVYVLGSIGLTGVATFMGLGIAGLVRENALRDDCAPSCSPGDVDAVRGMYVAGDVALGVGVIALGGALALYLLRPTVATDVTPPAPSSSATRAGPALFSVRGSF
jgi:hypothetical protein